MDRGEITAEACLPAGIVEARMMGSAFRSPSVSHPGFSICPWRRRMVVPNAGQTRALERQIYANVARSTARMCCGRSSSPRASIRADSALWRGGRLPIAHERRTANSAFFDPAGLGRAAALAPVARSSRQTPDRSFCARRSASAIRAMASTGSASVSAFPAPWRMPVEQSTRRRRPPEWRPKVCGVWT